MEFSEKSLNFARKILKHNPLPSSHSHIKEQHEHQHGNCSHEVKEQIKPYLHVHDHRKQRQIYEKPTEQKLSNMQTFKSEGNQHFRSQRFKQAAHYYQKVIIYADYTFPEAQKEQKVMEELVQTANCNLGITLMKLGEARKALQNFNQAVKGANEKIRIKANYWLSKCFIGLGEFNKASEGIQKLRDFGQKTMNQIKELQQQLEKTQQSYQKKSKNVYGQMFGKQSLNGK